MKNMIKIIMVLLGFVIMGCSSIPKITDETMAPIIDEEFPMMEKRIENSWTSHKKPSVIIYFCYDDRYGNQVVTVISNWIQKELESRFVNSGNYKVIDKTDLDRIIKEQKFQQTGLVDDRVMVDMGKMFGGNFLVTPKINSFGAFEAKITNIETGELIYTVSREITK